MTDTEEKGPFLGLHSQWEAKHPAEAEMEEIYERGRRGNHVQVHGTDAGYQPHREFPCPGVLREYDRSQTLIMAACDACGYETSFDRDDRPPRGARALEDA